MLLPIAGFVMISLSSLMVVGADGALVLTVVASALAIVIVSITLLQIIRIPKPESSDPAITFVKVLAGMLLIGGCIGIAWDWADVLNGRASVSDMWQWLGKVALAETLALSALHRLRKREDG